MYERLKPLVIWPERETTGKTNGVQEEVQTVCGYLELFGSIY